MLNSGSQGSSIGESRAVLLPYFGVAASPEYWSRSGKVWLRGRWLFVDEGRIGRAVGGGPGMNGDGAVPESGVKKGEVGLRGPGEKDEDGAVSVNALFKEVVLCEWNGSCLLENSK